jgi:TolA-binding protein
VLIPRLEKRSKNEKSKDISIECKKQAVPSTELKKPPKQCLELIRYNRSYSLIKFNSFQKAGKKFIAI